MAVSWLKNHSYLLNMTGQTKLVIFCLLTDYKAQGEAVNSI